MDSVYKLAGGPVTIENRRFSSKVVSAVERTEHKCKASLDDVQSSRTMTLEYMF